MPAGYLLRTDAAPFVPSKNNRERATFLDCLPAEYPGNGIGDYRESCIAVRIAGGRDNEERMCAQ